jgi:hypothetical protein
MFLFWKKTLILKIIRIKNLRVHLNILRVHAKFRHKSIFFVCILYEKKNISREELFLVPIFFLFYIQHKRWRFFMRRLLRAHWTSRYTSNIFCQFLFLHFRLCLELILKNKKHMHPSAQTSRPRRHPSKKCCFTAPPSLSLLQIMVQRDPHSHISSISYH